MPARSWAAAELRGLNRVGLEWLSGFALNRRARTIPAPWSGMGRRHGVSARRDGKLRQQFLATERLEPPFARQ
jgi:hypothetical protein